MASTKIKLVVMPGVYTPLNSNYWPTIALAYLSSTARSCGCNVSVLDAHLERRAQQDVLEWLRRDPPDVIGLSVPSEIVWRRTRPLLEGISADPAMAGAWCIAGGMDASLRGDTLLAEAPRLDAIVRGEGEAALRDLIAMRIETGSAAIPSPVAGMTSREPGGGLVHAGPRTATQDLDSLPMPDYGFALPAWEQGQVETIGIASSRGCPGNCLFCAVNPHWDTSPCSTRWRAHGPAYVLELMRLLSDRFGTTRFAFSDDCFLGAPGGLVRAASIADGMLASGKGYSFCIMMRVADAVCPGTREVLTLLKSAGLTSVFLGIDGCTDEDLAFYRKGTTWDQCTAAVSLLSDLDLPVVVGLIPIHPLSTRESILSALEGIGTLLDVHENLTFGYLGRIIAYQGTPMIRMRPGSINGTQALPPGLEPLLRVWTVEYYKLVGMVAEKTVGSFDRDETVKLRRILCRWQLETLGRIVREERIHSAPELRDEIVGLFARIASRFGISRTAAAMGGGLSRPQGQGPVWPVICDVD